MSEKEYIIFSDESEVKGTYYSNFYGGVMVGASCYEEITRALNTKKLELNLRGELKWSKVTEQYLEKYMQIMDYFFEELYSKNLKARIMFRQKVKDEGRTRKEIDNQYFMLYYQFIKHSFKLNSMPEKNFRLRLCFDQFPHTKQKVREFRSFLLKLPKTLKRNDIIMTTDSIIEVKSHQHILLQCIDIVLGSVCFKLNKKNKCSGTIKRKGKRTKAKEKLCTHIRKKICNIHPNFNIGVSTAKLKSEWNSPYAHWNFKPKK